MHKKLKSKYRWYAAWHQVPESAFVHYAILVAFTAFLATNIITFTNVSMTQLTASPHDPFADLQFANRIKGKKFVCGNEALTALGTNVERVAKHYGRTEKELRKELQQDKSLCADQHALLFYSDDELVPENATPGDGTIPNNPSSSDIPDALAFKLHSKPNASAKIYLDFDGRIVSGTNWNSSGTFTVAAYSFDGDPAFSSNELDGVKTIWRSVAEDYAAFNVDVTTEPPTNYSYDITHFIPIVITPTWEWYGQAGGVAYINSFRWANNTPAFVFSSLLGNNSKNIADAAAHEAGHTLGLRHQAPYDAACTLLDGYHWGSGSNPGFGPLMGASYNVGVTTLIDSNEYPLIASSLGCTAEQNDIDKITVPSTQWGDLRFANDETGDAVNSAAVLPRTVSNGIASVNHAGIMGFRDTDLYKFDALSGDIRLTINPMTGPLMGNADFRVRLLDSAQNVISESNPPAVGVAYVEKLGAAAGTYYLEIVPSGYLTINDPGGYTSTSSMGNYQIVGTYASGSGPIGDITPPTVSLTSPASGATLSNAVTLSASASDNVGVDHVDFYHGTTLIGADDSSPFRATWDTTTVTNGNYALTAKAYDAVGNNATSSVVNVTVSNAVTPPPDTTVPTVSMTAPANGSTVAGPVTLSATATDNVGVTKVSFYRGTTLIDTDTTGAPGFAITWNTAGVANGSYTLTAKAFDAANNSATSSAVTVTVENSLPDTTAPLTTLTAPSAGTTVSGTISVSADASDDVGVASVEFYIDNTFVASDATAPYSVSVDTKTLNNGGHSFSSKAYDAAGNSSSSSPVSVTVSNTTTPPVGDTTAPTVTITKPANGATVTGSTAQIGVTATDNVKVTKIEVIIDGALATSNSNKSSLSYNWNLKKVAAGAHTILVKAYDAAGNVGQSSISVTK